MRTPKLSKTQQDMLRLALIKLKRMNRQHVSYQNRFCFAIKRDINTVRVLGRLKLVCIQTGGWSDAVYYDLTDAGWLLAQALTNLQVRSKS